MPGAPPISPWRVCMRGQESQRPGARSRPRGNSPALLQRVVGGREAGARAADRKPVASCLLVGRLARAHMCQDCRTAHGMPLPHVMAPHGGKPWLEPFGATKGAVEQGAQGGGEAAGGSGHTSCSSAQAPPPPARARSLRLQVFVEKLVDFSLLPESKGMKKNFHRIRCLPPSRPGGPFSCASCRLPASCLHCAIARPWSSRHLRRGLGCSRPSRARLWPGGGSGLRAGTRQPALAQQDDARLRAVLLPQQKDQVFQGALQEVRAAEPQELLAQKQIPRARRYKGARGNLAQAGLALRDTRCIG